MQNDIQKSLEVLKQGGVLLYPTDTVWGIGCDATNQKAVQKLLSIKHKEDNTPMLILVDSLGMLERYVIDIPEVAYDVIELSDKPLSVIFEKGRNVADALLSDDGSLGVRLTNEAFTKQLLKMFRRPIVSTSANIHGMPAPQKFSDISADIKTKVDYVVEYRQHETTKQQESSIIRLQNNGRITIIRS